MNKISWIVFCTSVLAAAASAQQGEQSKGPVLEEVIVLAKRAISATKTDTPLVEIPQSISVVTAEQIADRGAVNYQDVFRYSGVDTEASGLEVRSDFFSLRGFALKQYLDGLNMTPEFVYGGRQEVFTLQRAEVLRGPSAVMYGAGSSGGLVNAVSKRPQFDFSGEVGLKIGNFETRQLQADVTGPLSEQFAGRIVGMVRSGELLSPGEKNDKYVVQPALTWKPGESTEITLIGLYSKEDLGTHTYLPYAKTTLGNAPGEPLIPHDFFVGEPGYNHMKADQYAATLLLSHRFNDMITFSSSSRYLKQATDYAEVWGYLWADEARTLLAREFYVLDANYRIINSDNRLQFDFGTGALTHKALVGVDYTNWNHDRREGFSCGGFLELPCWPGGSPPALNVYDPVYGLPFTSGFTNAYETKSTQLGIYLQDQMKWNDRVSVVLGVRHDDAMNQRVGSEELKNSATTFKVGIIGEVAKGISPYANYSESFTPLFGTDFYGNHYDPQESRQYEGGIKWQPNDNSLVTAAYFDIEETGFLTQDPDNIQNFIQGGAIGATGFEFEATLNFAKGFGLTANYTDLNAKVLKGTDSQPTGSRVPNLPSEIASLWVNKMFIVSDDHTWRLGAGVRHNGDEIDPSGTVRNPPVTLIDAMAELRFRDWDFSFNVNNLADKEYFAEVGPYIEAPAQTRVYFATVSKRF